MKQIKIPNLYEFNKTSSAYRTWKPIAWQGEIFKSISIERYVNGYLKGWLANHKILRRNIWTTKINILLMNKLNQMKLMYCFSALCIDSLNSMDVT